MPLSYAQVLSVSAASGAPGDTISIEVSLNCPLRQAPAALKWNLIFPAQLFEIESGPVIGAAVKASGKSLSCTSAREYSYSCIVFGGRQRIQSGSMAVFHFKIKAGSREGSFSLPIEGVDAVTAQVTRLKVTTHDGHVEIR